VGVYGITLFDQIYLGISGKNDFLGAVFRYLNFSRYAGTRDLALKYAIFRAVQFLKTVFRYCSKI